VSADDLRVDLSGKAAIVTGAASGIGRAIALRLGRAGARVIVDYRGEPAEAEAVVAEIERAGGSALAVEADVALEADAERLVASAVERFGALDVLVNNAGVEEPHPFVDTPLEVWERILRVDLTGPFLCSRAAARAMIARGRGGRIVNISSVHEDIPMLTNGPYCAAKGGLRMLMRTIAVELAPHGITVNNIAPGAIETPINAQSMRDPQKLKALLAEIPLGRMGRPREVAQLCAFLASDEAAYITGSTYVIDGGMMRQAGSL
jgi:glucose 1-dehydrogenase